jgi:hypothetical protein
MGEVGVVLALADLRGGHRLGERAGAAYIYNGLSSSPVVTRQSKND